jgi:hypothetical protein
VTSMFFVFLTRFNEESKRAALVSKVSGVMTTRLRQDFGGQSGQTLKTDSTTKKIQLAITVVPELTDEPSVTPISKKIVEIKVGEMEIEKSKIEVKVVKEEEEAGENIELRTKNNSGKIPWQVFDLKLIFLDRVKPGSSDNKFIFENKEYEVKVFNNKGEVLNSFMYKIFDDSIIINPEGGIWSGDAEFGVGIYSDGNKIGEVKFAVE